MVVLGYNTPSDNILPAARAAVPARVPRTLAFAAGRGPTRTVSGWRRHGQGRQGRRLLAAWRLGDRGADRRRSWHKGTTEEDEVISYDCALGARRIHSQHHLQLRASTARLEHYKLISERAGVKLEPSMNSADKSMTKSATTPLSDVGAARALQDPCRLRPAAPGSPG